MTESGRPYARAIGDRGTRVTFLHGLFGQGRNWTQVGKALAEQHRVLLVDLPHHGRSGWDDDFDYVRVAAQVAGLLDAGDPGALVGHSLGGKVAMVLALRHPELVERLVVVDIAPKGYGSLERFEGYIREMQALPLAELTSRGDAEARFTEPDPGVKAFLLQNLRRDGQAWRWQVNLDLVAGDAALGVDSRIADWPDDLDELPAYEGPVLWVAGGDSRYVRREDGERMRRHFPRTRLFTIKGAGHWVHTDAPEIIVTALRRFVADPA